MKTPFISAMRYFDLALLFVLANLLVAKEKPFCAGGNEYTTHTPGMNELKFWEVSLCSYSIDKKYIADFRALRTTEETDRGRGDIQVTLKLKNGKSFQFISTPVQGTNLYHEYFNTSYDPLAVVDFRIDAIRESWQEDAESANLQAKQMAIERQEKRARDKEQAEQQVKCRIIYNQTADKKVSDLTVRESHLVHACELRGLYHSLFLR